MNHTLDPVSYSRLLRNQDLAREAVRVHPIGTTTPRRSFTFPKATERVRDGLRYAVATLAALMSTS